MRGEVESRILIMEWRNGSKSHLLPPALSDDNLGELFWDSWRRWSTLYLTGADTVYVVKYGFEDS